MVGRLQNRAFNGQVEQANWRGRTLLAGQWTILMMADGVLGPPKRQKMMKGFARGCLRVAGSGSGRVNFREQVGLRGPRRIEKCGWLKISKRRVASR